MVRLIALCICVLALAGQAAARGLSPDGCGGDALLAHDGALVFEGLDVRNGQTTFRLAGLADDDWPDRDRAIADWLRTRPQVELHPASKPDRYGFQPVILFGAADDAPLQSELLERGLARLSGADDLPPLCLSSLAKAESAAIAARRGLWADPRFAILPAWDPDAMAPRLDSFQVVEGRILSTGRTSRRLYLNFGEYWAKDFTVEVTGNVEKALERAGMRLEDWVGARIRVRGWLSESRGPMMMIDGPNQIERLSD